MAETNYSVVDFSQLTESNDGKTLLYNNGELCQSTNSLSEIVDDKIGSKDYATETFVKNEIGKVGNFIVTPGDDDGPDLNAEEAQTKSIYLIESGSGKDKYREWIATGEVGSKTWTCIGDTTMNLSEYAKIADIPQIDEVTIILDDEDKLSVANPIPDSIGNVDRVLTVETNDGELQWKDPIVYRAGNGLTYSSGGSETTFHVSVPVPDPNPDDEHRATDGSVLTYDYDSDKIVWAEPQTYLTKDEADTYYASKSEFDDLVAWLAPISANLVIAASNN